MGLLLRIPGVRTVEFDFCMAGMEAEDEQGRAPVRRRTRVVANSPCLIEALERLQCSGDHRHIHLVHGRTGPAQVYPEPFCRVLCQAFARQIDCDRRGRHGKPIEVAAIDMARLFEEVLAHQDGCVSLGNTVNVSDQAERRMYTCLSYIHTEQQKQQQKQHDETDGTEEVYNRDCFTYSHRKSFERRGGSNEKRKRTQDSDDDRAGVRGRGEGHQGMGGRWDIGGSLRDEPAANRRSREVAEQADGKTEG